MGDLEKTVKIFFQGVDGLSKPLGTMSSKMNRFSSDVSKMGEPFANVTKGILALDAAIAAMVAGGLAYSLNQFASFEDRMLKVKGVLGANQEEYRQLTELTKDLGATTRYTAEEAASGLEFLALAGMSASESMEALPRVLELAQASGLALKDTADIVTNIMAGYGIETDKLAQTNDVLTATFTNSNTSLHQLGEAFKFVGPVAKSLGFSIEETAATLGILGNAGYQAEKGGTALRNIMIALVAPAGNMGKLMKELGVDTKEFGVDISSSRNALDSLGVSIKDSSGNILPFTEILAQVKTGLEKIPDEADRTATLIEIFGKRGGPQMAALLSQGAEAIDGLENKINSLGGVTGKIADEMESGLGGIKRALISAFDSVFIEIGEKSSDAIANGANSMAKLMRVISSEVKADTFKPIFDLMAEFSNELGENLDQIAENLPEALDGVEFDGLTESLRELAEVFTGLFDDVDLTSVEGLEKGIQGVVDGLSKLVSTTTGIAEVFVGIGGVIIDVVQALGELDDEQWEIAGNIAAVGTALTGLASVVAVGGALTAGIKAFAGLFASSSLLSTGITGIVALLSGPAGLVVGIGSLAAAVAGFSWGRMNKEHDETIRQMEDTRQKIQDVSEQISNLPTDVSTVEIWAAVDAGDLEKAQAMIDDVTGETHVAKVEVDASGVTNDTSWADDISQDIWVGVDVETENIEKAKEKVAELPTQKELEIKLQGEIDKDIQRIITSAETVQNAFEWTAKVDIAEVEAQAKIVESTFGSINTSIESTADLMGQALNALSDPGSFEQKWSALDILREEADLREKSFDLQKKLTEAQVRDIESRIEARENGESEITINCDGLEPTLEMIMWEIMKKVQVRANENASEFLLGITT